MKLYKLSKIEKLAFWMCCLATLTSVTLVIYFAFTNNFTWPMRRGQLLMNSAMVVASVSASCAIGNQRSNMAVYPFYIGNIGALISGIIFTLYAYLSSKDLKNYIKMMYEGAADTESYVNKSEIPAALAFIAVIFFVLPVIYTTVLSAYFCRSKNECTTIGDELGVHITL
ncbi:hypothetical protein L596_022193 [Steinernema carpocapsae]|uniref:Uncharacterized protein n=1 Tax=Steinernema carpocapsae TaxID=34508 RepID=A0A4U5MLV2_STECR|nr:hypothetical protein L596_022193 [Steinernema carpocapsae]